MPENAKKIFLPILERVSSQIEALTLMWCLDHYFPLIHAEKHPWLLVAYERLILNNQQEMKRITDAFDLDLNEKILEKLNRPSSSVKGNVNGNSEAQIAKWKQQLSTQQIDTILTMFYAAGFSDIYSDSPQPNYAKLNDLQNPVWKW